MILRIVDAQRPSLFTLSCIWKEANHADDPPPDRVIEPEPRFRIAQI